MEIQTVFESEDFLVIEKPAGMVVNRAQTVKGETVQDWAEKRLEDQGVDLEGESDFSRRAGIVHRLDKETSGLLVIAKNPKTFLGLQAQFKARKTEKKYLALVHRQVVPEEGEVNLPVGRNPFNREKFGVFPGGRKALTKYRSLSQFLVSGAWFSLLEVWPKTGRTHQIRVHLKALGHPVVSDAKYAGRKTNRADRKWCSRMFLHASFLGFFHPRTKKWLRFESPLPDDLEKALRFLKRKTKSSEKELV